jgi:hypothetical protein
VVRDQITIRWGRRELRELRESWESWESSVSTYEDHALHTVLDTLHHVLQRLHPLDDDWEFGILLRTPKVSQATRFDVECASRTRMKLISSQVKSRS